jgi:hypothetical protein
VELLEQNEGGFYCDGHADGLARFLLEYDFEAYPVSFGVNGDSDDLTGDAATVVVSKKSGALYLLSSMFNMRLLKGDDLCPMSEYYRLMREGKRDSVRFSVSPVNQRYLTQSPIISETCELYSFRSRSVVRLGNTCGTYVIEAPRPPEKYLTGHFNDVFIRIHESWKQQIVNSGIGYDYQDHEDSDLFPLYIEGVYVNPALAAGSEQHVWKRIREARGF